MKICISIIGSLILLSCNTSKHISSTNSENFKVVFASCNDQDMQQPLWKPILENHPDVFIWGGDNIYADTDDPQKMKRDYDKVLAQPDYKKLTQTAIIIGTWDDHDYGKNDAGASWHFKEEAQQLFLDFLHIPENDIKRNRAGVYDSKKYITKNGIVKIILLDTRYFRSPLKKSSIKGQRYQPWNNGAGGTVLGTQQWQWLEHELADETPVFTVIVSSIQFLANEHHWEQWGNFPDEVYKMKNLISNAKSKNIIIFSGDRHLAEFSKTDLDGLNYPLIDFTSSGMTKTYPNTPDDKNKYRVGKQIKQLNFGLIDFDLKNRKVIFEIRGKNNELLEQMIQQY
ncbi:MAG: alkaline phosphatase D family protein [Flavobacteriales bacterium]